MKTGLVICSVFFTIAISAVELHVGVSSTPIAVDGNLGEYVYVGYDWSASFIVFDRENAVTNGLFEPVGKPFSDLKTQCGVFTDRTNLYVTILAPCAVQVPPDTADGVGVAVSPDGKAVFVAECGVDGRCSVSRVGADGTRRRLAKSGVRSAVNIGKCCFNVEIACPYAALGQIPDGGGAVWKCNIYRMGPSCGGMSSWAPVQGDIFNTDRFGDIVFGKQKKIGAPLTENKGKEIFLWAGDRWGGGPEVKPPLDLKELEKVSLCGPRSGRAVAHFRVSNLSDIPALYSLTVNDFAKNEFAKRVRFREVEKVELKGGPTVPDPIFDLPNGSILRIPPKSTAMVWVDVDTDGMEHGLHNAELTLVPGYSKFKEKRIALELTVGRACVKDVLMPTWTYGSSWRPERIALVKDYRMNVLRLFTPMFAPKTGTDGKRNWLRFDAAMEAMRANGIETNEMYILCYDIFPRWNNPRDNPKIEREYIDNMRAGIVHAKERWGIGLDRIWLSTVDEPNGDPDDPKRSASFAFYGARLAKCIDPKLKSWTNPWNGRDDQSRFLPRYLETFDTLVPFLSTIDRDDPNASDRYARSGRDVWSYVVYCKPNRPYQYRVLSWKNFAYGFNGPATFYTLIDAAGDPFNSYDQNGATDYGAMYFDERTGQTATSLRMEAWYQGHLEQRLLKWCKARIDAMRDKKKVSVFVGRLDDLVKRATAPRSNLDAISRELLTLSDEIEAAKERRK